MNAYNQNKQNSPWMPALLGMGNMPGQQGQPNMNFPSLNAPMQANQAPKYTQGTNGSGGGMANTTPASNGFNVTKPKDVGGSTGNYDKFGDYSNSLWMNMLRDMIPGLQSNLQWYLNGPFQNIPGLYNQMEYNMTPGGQQAGINSFANAQDRMASQRGMDNAALFQGMGIDPKLAMLQARNQAAEQTGNYAQAALDPAKQQQLLAAMLGLSANVGQLNPLMGAAQSLNDTELGRQTAVTNMQALQQQMSGGGWMDMLAGIAGQGLGAWAGGYGNALGNKMVGKP